MAAVASFPCSPQALTFPALSPADLDPDGLRLRIINSIERGMGVVPSVGADYGDVLLRQGEVAVYDENWLLYNELAPGLYCYESQTPVACSPFPDSRRDVRRRVVSVTRYHATDLWGYRDLRSRLHRGVRIPARTEGPMHEAALAGLLLGPVIGLYQPRPEMVS